jgi:hypothetical protein
MRAPGATLSGIAYRKFPMVTVPPVGGCVVGGGVGACVWVGLAVWVAEVVGAAVRVAGLVLRGALVVVGAAAVLVRVTAVVVGGAVVVLGALVEAALVLAGGTVVGGEVVGGEVVGRTDVGTDVMVMVIGGTGFVTATVCGDVTTGALLVGFVLSAELAAATGVAEPPAWPTGEDACAADWDWTALLNSTINGQARSRASIAGSTIHVRRMHGFSAARALAFSRQPG